MNKTIIKFSSIAYLCVSLLFLWACADDKGNYSYDEKNNIIIGNLPYTVTLIAGKEYLDLKPYVFSSLDGELTDANENFEFVYQRKEKEKWIDLGNQKDLHVLPTMGTGTHTCRFVITDKRTGIKRYELFYIEAKTQTTEGWMVLCDEGSEERVRLDMLTQISVGRVFPVYDVIPTDADFQPIHHATSLGTSSFHTSIPHKIVLMSEEGAYVIPVENTEKGYGAIQPMSANHELKQSYFLTQTDDHIVRWASIPCNITNAQEYTISAGKHDAVLCVSKEGNVYAWNTLIVGGAFEYPINVDKRGEKPTYRVAPFIGTNMQRDLGTSYTYGVALFYDTDNHRFIGWDSEKTYEDANDTQGIKQKCYPLKDPEENDKKFSFQTGNMDLVCMLSTAFNGQVYCIMQDGVQRHIYGINVATNKFEQIGAYTNIAAPDFDKATTFAASSLNTVIYYAYGNKVYAYNYSAGQTEEVATLPTNEEVTMLTIMKYDEPLGHTTMAGSIFANKDEATRSIYFDREKQLIVGSYDKNATDNNGGILRFYDPEEGSSGMKLVLKEDKDEDGNDRVWEYKGFARIKDVRYKESL